MAKNKVVSVLTLQKYKSEGTKIVALTAYDYATAQILDRAGVDVILVGDSLAMVALGHRTTHSVTVDQMLHHARAVTRGVQNSLVVADLPFMSYQVEMTQAITNAGRFVKEAQAHAVKLEGATDLTLDIVERLVGLGIPVMGHLGFTPQAIHGLGGNRVQGRTAKEAFKLLRDAQALERAGAFSVVLEMVPHVVAKLITQRIGIPTIGIGAGNECDGQILVTDDLLGKYTDFKPKFVRRYANLAHTCHEAVVNYARDVMSQDFPNDSESFEMQEEEETLLRSLLADQPVVDASKLAREPL
ncbi:MAG: 3-methyl-2-oxobutanoate hydroxymethyltransferase [Candidatus Melainabacteria bacterium]|nr:MAG: 3-methyl-2-oxobutanoate hydroxymethyltransferase [Candidatus Melainabacteria bacterium]